MCWVVSCIADDVSLCVVGLSGKVFTPVIVPGIPTAGENFNLTCRLAGTVERLVTGTVTLSFPPVSLFTAVTGAPIMVSQKFTPVRTSNAGSYTCDATIRNTPTSGNFLSDEASGELLIQSNVMLLLH